MSSRRGIEKPFSGVKLSVLYQLSVCYMRRVASEWSKGGRNPSLEPEAFAVSSGGSAPS